MGEEAWACHHSLLHVGSVVRQQPWTDRGSVFMHKEKQALDSAPRSAFQEEEGPECEEWPLASFVAST